MANTKPGAVRGWLRHSGFVAVTAAGLLVATSLAVLAQLGGRLVAEGYAESSHMADTLLRSAAVHAADQQWAEAVAIYQRVIEQFGDKVASLPRDDPGFDPKGESRLLVDVRQYCQRKLAALPADALAIYRTRIDPQAQGWYEKGAAGRDKAMLRRVVEEAFCSSWGDDALDLLGDLAFQDGRFDEALASYRQLVPDGPPDPLTLTYPDPSVDLARVAAKKLLCRAALGEPPTRAELADYATTYPKAKGHLAGRDGSYAEILDQALARDSLPLPAQLDNRWPTFAGSPTRTKIAPGSIDVGMFQWKAELALQTPTQFRTTGRRFPRGGFGNIEPAPSNDQPLAYHPIVLGDQVIVGDEKQVVAYYLNERPSEGQSGAPAKAWVHEQHGQTPTSAARQLIGTPRFTLTAYGERIYARLGPPGSYIAARVPSPVPSVLVALDRSTDGKLLWEKQSTDIALPLRQAEPRAAGFEGSPVADAHNVYVALTEAGVQTTTYVACLDADTGATRWVRFVWQASAANDNGIGFGISNDVSHRLLTLDGSTVYYQTNLGAVAALDAETGRVRWLATYARQERNGGASGGDRDLNPAVVHDGRVIVAPDDTSRLYAFDAVSGRLVWKSEPLEITHMLGVAKGRVVATGNQVFTLDVTSGKLLSRWPDSAASYVGFGRGLLAGEQIYWPTKTDIHILDQATGLRADRPPIKLQENFQTGGGNLAVGDGYLIVAQPEALVVFCQNSRLIERYRDAIARVPDEASNYFRLAQAAEATRQDDLALESLATAVDRAKPAETIDGQPLLEVARDRQYHLLMKLGANAAAERKWADSAMRYDEASRVARSDRDRLSARFRLANAQAEQGEAPVAVATLQALLSDERLRPLTVSADEHRTVRADLLIADRLAALVSQHGRGLYEQFDQEAEKLLDRGKSEKDARLLKEVGRTYPVARVVPDALLALGALCESEGRHAEAAQAYKRLQAIASSDADRAQALWGLARVYEAQKLWVLARDTYLQAMSRFADQPIQAAGSRGKLGELAAERLGREPFDRMIADRAEPSLSMPLARLWDKRWSETMRPISAEGVPPSAQAARIFLAERTKLAALDPKTGEMPWSRDLGDEPVWVGYLADHVIVGMPTAILALSLDKGTVTWRTGLEAPRPGAHKPNPFAKPGGGAGAGAGEGHGGEPAGKFHDFRIVGGRICCLRGDREILSLDGDTGLADWSYIPTAGRINPLVAIGPARIVLQVRKPNAILVLETVSGRCRAEFRQSEEEEWARAPFAIDDEHVILVADRRTVAMFDLERGVTSWSFRESTGLPRNGPPRLLGDSERLLVLQDGSELIRLDPRTGGRLWARPLGSEDLSERPESLAIDAERFYWIGGQSLGTAEDSAQLEAISLNDGKVVWKRYLSGAKSKANWSIALAEHAVVAYPTPLRPGDGELNSLPLVFCRRDTGAFLQRLLFPSTVSHLAVRLAPRSVLVATQAGGWALGDRP